MKSTLFKYDNAVGITTMPENREERIKEVTDTNARMCVSEDLSLTFSLEDWQTNFTHVVQALVICEQTNHLLKGMTELLTT
jgi:hypothetical protein